MEWNTLVYGILAVVVIGVIGSGFYVLTNPQVDLIKNLKCSIPGLSAFVTNCTAATVTQQQITQQTQQAQLQNVQNLVGAVKYKFETCGKNDPREKCRCTFAFGTIGENSLVITQLKDKIRITTSSGKSEEANYSTLYYDDGNHNLNDNLKLNEGDQIIFERKIAQHFWNFEQFFIKLKKKEQSIQDAQIIKNLNSLNSKELSEYANAAGLFKDKDKVGLYIPNVRFHWIFGDWEKEPLPECKQ